MFGDLRRIIAGHLCGFASDALKVRWITAHNMIGYIKNGRRHDGYSGCRFGHILIFSDNTGLPCDDYDYDYSPMPTAFLFANGTLITACIDGDMISLKPMSSR